jgi:hypothetical protein
MALVPRRLYAALCEVAQRRAELTKLRPDGVVIDPNWAVTEAGRKWTKRQHELEHIMEVYASDPDLRQNMTCWMVDFEGTETPDEKMVYDASPMASQAQFGVVPKKVRQWLEANKFEISDSGSGLNGWHLGIPCTDDQARMLCVRARIEFKDYLEAGVLAIRLAFWGWRFTKLRTDEDVNKFLRERLVS